MTHDELLFKIYEIHNNSSDAGQEATKQYKGMIQFMQALRAVVGLHKPNDRATTSSNFTGEWVSNIHCYDCHSVYPCPTIQAIEKELG